MQILSLKNIISKIVQWSLLVAGILFIFYVVLISNLSFFTPYLQQYSSQITTRLSTTFARPVEVGSFVITKHNFQPVLVLHDVNILSADSAKVLWYIRELHIGIDIWHSILQRHIAKEWIKIDGTTVVLQANADGNVGLSINGISLGSLKSDDVTTAGLLNKQSPQNGSVKIRLAHVILVADKWFAQPITLDEFKGKVVWQMLPQELNIGIQRAVLKNAALKLKGNVWVTWPKQNENLPHVDAQIDFSSTQLDKLQNFYPVKIMHVSLVQWLKTAFPSLGSIDGLLTLRGDLAHFPFADNSGIFKVDIALHKVDFFYHKDWPKLQDLNGHLLFEGKSMEVVADSAVMTGVLLHNITASIDNLLSSLLVINGQVNTSATIAQQFITATPLQQMFGRYFTHVDLGGPITVGLHMMVPLAVHGQPTQVNGVVNLQNNTLLLKSWNILLHDISGAISFTNDVIAADNLNAFLFNKPIALHINTTADSSDAKQEKITRIVFNHTASLTTLAQHFTAPIFSYLQGDLNYQGILLLPHNRGKNITLEIASNLRDIAINYPPLLVKAAGVAHDFSARFVFLDEMSATQIFLYYKDVLSAALNFVQHKDYKELAAGELRFGKGKVAKVPPNSGLLISGELSKLDWSEWQQYLWPTDKAKDSKGESNVAALRKVVKKVDVKIGELHIFGRVFSALRLVVIPHENKWWISLDSAIVKGILSVPSNLSQDTVIANLQKLYLTDAKTTQKNTLNPKDLPRLHITISDLHYGDKELGKLEVQTEPTGGGLRVVRLVISAANFMLEGVGKWMQVDKFTQSFLQGKVTSKDTGTTLKQLHFTESLAGGNGVLSFALGWQGAFYSIDTPSLDGEVKVNIQKGRIINLGAKTEAEMGIGRLLSILGLQTLPRRLTLDFSDLVKDGFSFDVLQGDFKFTKGNAFTQNMVLGGPAAQVEVRGRIGFAAKNYDIDLTVIPRLTSSLPVIATVAGTPLLGAATWVAEKLIGGQVSRVMEYVYKVKGSWINPDIQKK